MNETRDWSNGSQHIFRRIRAVGFIVLAIQLVLIGAWSNFLVQRFALTFDFSIYHQAWFLIGHGNINPFDTINGYSFWKSHGEFFMWPLSFVTSLWPHAVTLMWMQDLSLVCAEAATFVWISEVIEQHCASEKSVVPSVVLAIAGLIFLVGNPWIYWTLSWDFHLEMVGILFVVLCARALWRDSRNWHVWFWMILGLSCGDVVATYLVGVGLSAAIVQRNWRSRGMLVASFSLLWLLFLSGVGANEASSLATGYGYLTTTAAAGAPEHLGVMGLVSGILRHPISALHTLWTRRLGIYAAIASAGLIGVFAPWVVIPSALVLLENGLNSYLVFLDPGFQDALLFLLIPLGTVMILARIGNRRRVFAVGLPVLLTINTLAWGFIWVPKVEGHWVSVTANSAQELSLAQKMIPSGAEVVVSQGVSGRFSNRQWVYPLLDASKPIPLKAKQVWFVLAPRVGIETVSVVQSDAVIFQLARLSNSALVAEGAGVWVFRWTPPRQKRYLSLAPPPSKVPAWTATGSAGAAELEGAPAKWSAISTGGEGYVVSGDYWREPIGTYVASLVLSSQVRVNVEVWNASADVLLARRDYVPVIKQTSLRIPFKILRESQREPYHGFGIFEILPLQPPRGNRVEIRVWSPGNGKVTVTQLGVRPLK